jgi:hypothetical protein
LLFTKKIKRRGKLMKRTEELCELFQRGLRPVTKVVKESIDVFAANKAVESGLVNEAIGYSMARNTVSGQRKLPLSGELQKNLR